MLYWTSPNGTILRAESENGDSTLAIDGTFAAPFLCNPIVGCNLFDFVSGDEIDHLYRALATRVLETGQTINFVYRCDSPGIRREMSMELSRDEGMVRYKSVVVRETLRARAVPWQTPGAPMFVAICSFCQNYRFPISSRVWKNLEKLLTEQALPDEFSFTHGICDVCYLGAMSTLD